MEYQFELYQKRVENSLLCFDNFGSYFLQNSKHDDIYSVFSMILTSKPGSTKTNEELKNYFKENYFEAKMITEKEDISKFGAKPTSIKLHNLFSTQINPDVMIYSQIPVI